MRAVGDSLRLKKRFGAGYHIQLVTTPEKVDLVKEKVKRMLPGMKFDEISFLVISGRGLILIRCDINYNGKIRKFKLQSFSYPP